MELDVIHNADCVEGLKQIQNNSVNLVLTDIPYGEINKHAGNRGGGAVLQEVRKL